MLVAALALALGSLVVVLLLRKPRVAAAAGALAVALGAALVVHLVREATGPDHSLGELWWLVALLGRSDRSPSAVRRAPAA